MKSPARTAGEYGPRGLGTPGGVILSIMPPPSMTFRFQEPLGLHGRHAARSRRRDRLPVRPVLHIARMKDAGNIGAGPTLRQDIAVGVSIDLAFEHRRVRNMADGDEK